MVLVLTVVTGNSIFFQQVRPWILHDASFDTGKNEYNKDLEIMRFKKKRMKKMMYLFSDRTKEK